MTRTFFVLLRVVVFFTFIGSSALYLKAQESFDDPCCFEGSECGCCRERHQGQRVYAGPELYYLHRVREGGTKQHGWMFGGRAGYDRIKRCRIYWGVEGFYAKGTLKGESGGGKRLKSHFTDYAVEGRLGYTFQCKSALRKLYITPYAGYGYASEINKFGHPSPLPVHFKTWYTYATGGFLSGFCLADAWDLGLNVKIRYMLDPKCKVSNDPDYRDTTQHIDSDKVQYRIELPVTYYSPCYTDFTLSLTPFYEYRHYGKKANYPFDFFETQFRLYGVTLELNYYL